MCHQKRKGAGVVSGPGLSRNDSRPLPFPRRLGPDRQAELPQKQEYTVLRVLTTACVKVIRRVYSFAGALQPNVLMPANTCDPKSSARDPSPFKPDQSAL